MLNDLLRATLRSRCSIGARRHFTFLIFWCCYTGRALSQNSWWFSCMRVLMWLQHLSVIWGRLQAILFFKLVLLLFLNQCIQYLSQFYLVLYKLVIDFFVLLAFGRLLHFLVQEVHHGFFLSVELILESQEIFRTAVNHLF